MDPSTSFRFLHWPEKCGLMSFVGPKTSCVLMDRKDMSSKNLIWGKYAWFAKKLAGSLPLIRSLALFYAYMITSFDYYSQPASLCCCCQSVFDFSLCTPKDIFTKSIFGSPFKLKSFKNLKDQLLILFFLS